MFGKVKHVEWRDPTNLKMKYRGDAKPWIVVLLIRVISRTSTSLASLDVDFCDAPCRGPRGNGSKETKGTVRKREKGDS
jgi:hypothetical protein